MNYTIEARNTNIADASEFNAEFVGHADPLDAVEALQYLEELNEASTDEEGSDSDMEMDWRGWDFRIIDHDGNIGVSEFSGNEKCAIAVTRQFYGPKETIAWVNDGQDKLVFENSDHAQKWINESESETYECSHNESGSPTYQIFGVK